MHDIDRTLADMGSELEFEDEMEFEDEYEADEYETEDEFEDEFEEEYEDEDEDEFEFEAEGVFSEEEEYQLAAELLEAADDAELEFFLGKLLKRARSKLRRAGRRIRNVAKSSFGRALRKGLKRIAKRALPIAGRAVGTAFGGPVGGAIGARVAKAGGRIFGLELEGMSTEDQEFEVARRVVRLAGAAAKAAATQPSTGSGVMDAKAAVARAAKVHAPGLVARRPRVPSVAVAAAGSVGGRSGRWVRRGRRIVLMGV